WFIAQLLGRVVQKFPITTLELFNLGTVVCAMLTYAFWWEKPFDIECPIIVDEPERPAGTEGDSVVPDELYIDGLLVDKNYKIPSNALVSGILGSLLGALHIVAWNFAFPTEVERMTWRVGSVLYAVAPLVFSAASFWIEKYWVCVALVSVTVVVQLLVRAFTLIEMLVGLRSVSKGVFKIVEWSEYFPYFV
ncbi:hypothetical protein K505DRAFT_256503, partial [Melanomma pulvis-pyrius CBS 109.77]